MKRILEHNTIWRVGLTGGIGSGKTAVSDRLEALGAKIIDTDVISRELTAPNGLAIEAIKEKFGDLVITENNALNRDHMRELIVSDQQHRKTLEAILHPLIREQAQRSIATTKAPYVVIVVPLLAENAEWLNWLDDIVVVDCEPEIQMKRVHKRSGWPETQIQQMIKLQASRENRLKIATQVLKNNGDRHNLSLEIELLHEILLQNASKSIK